MPMVTATLKMFDAMTRPLQNITNSMNLMLSVFEDMQSSANRNMKIDQTLTAAKKQLTIAESEIKKSIDDATKAQQRFEQAVNNSKKSADGLGSSIKRWAAGLAGAYLSYKSGQQLLQSADTYVTMRARLDLITDEGQNVDELRNMIFAMSQRVGADFNAMSDSIARLGLLARDAFGSTEEIVAFTELMQKAFAVSGAGAQEQAAAMYQLSQAMAAGALQGDEFRSIMENAPMLADAIAKFVGVSKGELKKLSSEGKITADIIKGALFNAAEDINAKYEQIPTTFGAMFQRLGNTAFRAFEPVFKHMSEWLNSEQGQRFYQTLTNAIYFAAGAVDVLTGLIIGLTNFIQNNWPLIAPIVWGIVAAITAYKLATLASAAATKIYKFALDVKKRGLITAAAAQWGLNAAMLASPITWVVLGIIALVAAIYLVVAAINKFAGTSISATGLIAGAFAFLGAFIWNTVVGVINAIIQYLWTYLVEPWISIVEWVLNVFNGGFNSFGDAVKNLLGQIISWFLSLGKVVTKIIDAIFGTDWTAGLESLQDSILKWGKNEQAITLSREAPMIDAYIDYGKAWDAGYEWGSNLFSGFDKMTQNMDDMAAAFKNGGLTRVGEVGKIRNTVDISSEDLKMMRELAEINAINNFVTLTPTITFGDTHVRNESDIKKIIANIEEYMNEQLASSAKGLHGIT